jgi:ABC-type nitrate/sulfonate/bicarbonate transport system substrate-binding protein
MSLAAADAKTGDDAGETIHYSRCQMVPTASSLAFQLGYLGTDKAARAPVRLAVSLGDFDHEDDRLWMRHAGTTKSIWKRSLGADTRVIGLSWHDNAQPVYALPGGPVASPADLKGRRIALFHTPQKFDVDRMVFVKPYVAALSRAGLRLADVQIVDTPLERELVKDAAPTAKNFFLTVAELFVRQLIRGEVDAIATPLPAEIVRFFDLQKIYDTKDDPDVAVRTELRMLTVSGAALREHRDRLVQLLARLIAAGAWAANNPNDARRHLATDLTVDETVLRVRGIDPVRLTALDLSPEQIDALAKKKDFLIAVGAVDRDFAIRDWIDASVLRDARTLAGQEATA